MAVGRHVNVLHGGVPMLQRRPWLQCGEQIKSGGQFGEKVLEEARKVSQGTVLAACMDIAGWIARSRELRKTLRRAELTASEATWVRRIPWQ